ncbi:MAG TPA: hypothetical protein VFW87_02595 [Pirellulales bacterium]|nr:hypothetical protein [Pirellulales bacterium]
MRLLDAHALEKSAVVANCRMRRNGLIYQSRKKLIRCEGRKSVVLPFRFAGADDEAGPNYTGQPAVNSYYGWAL